MNRSSSALCEPSALIPLVGRIQQDITREISQEEEMGQTYIRE